MGLKVIYCCPKCNSQNILFRGNDGETLNLKKMYFECVDCKWKTEEGTFDTLEKLLIKVETRPPIIPLERPDRKEGEDEEITVIIENPSGEASKEDEIPEVMFDPNDTPKGTEIKFQLVK